MKKMIFFAIGVIIIFIGIGIFMQNNNATQAVGKNIYQKDTLYTSTIKDLSDPIYQNIILPTQLETDMKQGKELFIFFFSPDCSHCRVAAPIIVPLAQKLGINLQLFNLLEFPDAWDTYHIEYTPTLVHYKNGKEVDRLVGEAANTSEYTTWFTKNKNQ